MAKISPAKNLIVFKLFYFVFGLSVSLFLYFSASRILIFTPINLSPTIIDKNIPFVPWAVWIYLGIFPFLLLITLTLKSKTQIYQLFKASLILTIFSCLIFWFIPTQIPRNFYAQFNNNSYTYQALNWVRFIDLPVNCIPSLHISTSVLFILVGRKSIRGNQFWLWLVFVFIVWAVMALKQHYTWDILSGSILGWSIYKLFFKIPKMSF